MLTHWIPSLTISLHTVGKQEKRCAHLHKDPCRNALSGVPLGCFALSSNFQRKNTTAKAFSMRSGWWTPSTAECVCVGLLSVSIFQGLTLREVMMGNNWGPLCLLRQVSKD